MLVESDTLDGRFEGQFRMIDIKVYDTEFFTRINRTVKVDISISYDVIWCGILLLLMCGRTLLLARLTSMLLMLTLSHLRKMRFNKQWTQLRLYLWMLWWDSCRISGMAQAKWMRSSIKIVLLKNSLEVVIPFRHLKGKFQPSIAFMSCKYLF